MGEEAAADWDSKDLYLVQVDAADTDKVICFLYYEADDYDDIPGGDSPSGGSGSGDPATTIKGDVNGDGEVNEADAELMAQYLANGSATDFQEAAADMNKDDKIDVADGILLCQELKTASNTN